MKNKNYKENLKNAFSLEGAKRNGIWFFKSLIWLFIVIFVLDISSKWAVQNAWQNPVDFDKSILSEDFAIIPGFITLNLEHNLGAAFGIGSNGEVGWRIFWCIISVILTIALVVYYVFKFKTLKMSYRVGVMMMISGAFSNMIDRLFYWKNIVGFDGVIDWINIKPGVTHFNLADSSLVIGVIILIIVIIVDAIKDSKGKGKQTLPDLSEIEKNASDKNNKKSDEEVKINIEYIEKKEENNIDNNEQDHQSK